MTYRMIVSNGLPTSPDWIVLEVVEAPTRRMLTEYRDTSGWKPGVTLNGRVITSIVIEKKV